MKSTRTTMALALTVALVLLLPAMAWAATGSQDGLEATLTTDKTQYAIGESVVVRASVKNTNAFPVTDVKLELRLPAGIVLKTGNTSTSTASLAAGESASLSLTGTVTDPSPVAPPTGDNSPLGLLLLLALLLCGVLALGASVPVGRTLALEKDSFSVDKSVRIGDDKQEFFIEFSIKYDPIKAGDLVITPDKATLAVGDKLQLRYTGAEWDVSPQYVTWSSSNNFIATVRDNKDSTATVTGVSPGSCTITVTTVTNGQSAACAVTVTAVPAIIPVTGVSLDRNRINGWDLDSQSDLEQLVATVVPANATNQVVT